MFTQIMPVLRVSDIQAAIGWYIDVGFALCWHQPNDGGGENCMLSAGDTHIMLSTGSHLGGAPQFTGTLYFETSGGVEDLYHRIKDRAEIVWPLAKMDYGTLEFGVKDRDGYTVAFAEDLKSEGL